MYSNKPKKVSEDYYAYDDGVVIRSSLAQPSKWIIQKPLKEYHYLTSVLFDSPEDAAKELGRSL